MARAWYRLSENTADLAADEDACQDHVGNDHPADCFHQYMQVVVRAIDDNGNDVADYFIEFSDGSGGDDRQAAEFFHTEMLESVKRNSMNPAYRCFNVDRTDLRTRYYPMVADADERHLLMTIAAAPPGGNVAYFGGRTYSAEAVVSVHRETEREQRWFRRNQTHYVEIIIPRVPRDEVFRLRPDDEQYTDV